jgi:hypothetical protein
LAHVVENFQKELEGIKYVKTFETLKMRYEQQQDRLKDRMAMEGYVLLFFDQSLCFLWHLHAHTCKSVHSPH